MQYRTFGKLGYEVSALGMGCMRLPQIIDDQGKAEVDREKAYEIIRYAAEHGVNYFDTAYGYHSQNSEVVLGEALDNGLRKNVKIATKQPFGVMKTQDDIRRNLENTLKKLRTDYIDLYLIHCIMEPTWEAIKSRKIIEEFEKFRDEGLIRGIGFSYHGAFPLFRDILNFYPWDMVQVQQNMIDVDKEVTAEAITEAGNKGTALVIMEPLRGGGLCTPPESVRKIYDEYPVKRSGTEWAFRHLLDRPEVDCILSGVTTLEQLKENIALFSQSDTSAPCLSDEERGILARAKEAYENIVTIPCTGCEYCLPCPKGVNIPRAFALYNEGMMFGGFDQPRRSYMFVTNAGAEASKCIGCKACEAKCPQKLSVADQLKTAHEKLKGWVE